MTMLPPSARRKTITWMRSCFTVVIICAIVQVLQGMRQVDVLGSSSIQNAANTDETHPYNDNSPSETVERRSQKIEDSYQDTNTIVENVNSHQMNVHVETAIDSRQTEQESAHLHTLENGYIGIVNGSGIEENSFENDSHPRFDNTPTQPADAHQKEETTAESNEITQGGGNMLFNVSAAAEHNDGNIHVDLGQTNNATTVKDNEYGGSRPENVTVNISSKTSNITDTLDGTVIEVENQANSTYLQIRKWGCGRNDAPFIFVHIGKAGGGNVRARIAAAALDYNRSGWYDMDNDKSYYYPIRGGPNSTLHKGRFSSSKINNMIPPTLEQFFGEFQYEGLVPCSASTPLGLAIACPMETSLCGDRDGDKASKDRCDLIYTGHNVIGNEFHWLPTKYLSKWWKSTQWGGIENDDFMDQLIKTRHTTVDNQQWNVPKKVHDIVQDPIPVVTCPSGPYGYRAYKRSPLYPDCLKPKEKVVDELAHHVVNATGKSDPYRFIPYAQMLANLPVLRVTVLRDPFSWLTSKFFWHSSHYSRNGTLIGPRKGESKDRTRRKRDQQEGVETPPLVACDDLEEAASPDGWASVRALTYIFYLCGEHCLGGYADGSMTIDDMEQQAAYNLRNSFAVVGLLQETDKFFEMLSQRVAYMDTSLNLGVEGKKHGSGDFPEALRCKEVFANPEFQANMTAKSPALAALNRLYKVGLEVNEFQAKELAECST